MAHLENKIVLFNSSDGDVSLEVLVNASNDEVWLSKEQMALLFEGIVRSFLVIYQIYIKRARSTRIQLVQNLHKFKLKGLLRQYPS